MTGDTDLAPAVKTAQRLFPEKEICFAFPYARKNRELAQLVKTHFRIGRGSYLRHQLPDRVVLRDGRTVKKPLAW